ncbi:MAG: 30S ribosomal protein S16 [Gammaproteobacteria bacterium]|nr:MAG: 30S ribosomal protein S16 [Gammaproteobacteria bacterium]
MVKIRLSRGGSKNAPFYHIVATDSRNKRDGRYLERLGFFNPIAKGVDLRFNLDITNIQKWQEKGAQTSDRVLSLIKEQAKT